MKIPHSNCWYFYYSGAWGRKFPHGECWCFYYSVHWAKIPHGNCWRFLLLRALGKISPQQLLVFLLLWCISELLRTIPKLQTTFCTLKYNKTALGRKFPFLFGSVARPGTNKKSLSL